MNNNSPASTTNELSAREELLAISRELSAAELELEPGQAETAQVAGGLSGIDTSVAIDNSVQLYLQAIGRTPRLDAEQEIHLARQIASDDPAAAAEACSQLVRANLRLVVSIAKKYSFTRISLLDLVQEGNTGLLRAAEKFRAEFGCRFSTYAVHWIKQAVVKSINQRKRPFKLPQHILDKLNRINRINEQLTREFGREPTEMELLVNLEDADSPEELSRLRELDVEAVSLDASLSSDGESAALGETIADSDAPSPESSYYQKALRNDLQRLISHQLTADEQQVIIMRYGLTSGGEPAPLDEVAEIIGMSREKTKQLEFRALRKLKHTMDEKMKDYLGS